MENGRESEVIGALQRMFWILWNYVYANCRPRPNLIRFSTCKLLGKNISLCGTIAVGMESNLRLRNEGHVTMPDWKRILLLDIVYLFFKIFFYCTYISIILTIEISKLIPKNGRSIV